MCSYVPIYRRYKEVQDGHADSLSRLKSLYQQPGQSCDSEHHPHRPPATGIDEEKQIKASENAHHDSERWNKSTRLAPSGKYRSVDAFDRYAEEGQSHLPEQEEQVLVTTVG